MIYEPGGAKTAHGEGDPLSSISRPWGSRRALGVTPQWTRPHIPSRRGPRRAHCCSGIQGCPLAGLCVQGVTLAGGLGALGKPPFSMKAGRANFFCLQAGRSVHTVPLRVCFPTEHQSAEFCPCFQRGPGLILCLSIFAFFILPSLPFLQPVLFRENKREAWHIPLLWWGPQRWHWCLLLAESSGGTQPWVPGSRHGGPGVRALVCLAPWQPLWDQEASTSRGPSAGPSPRLCSTGRRERRAPWLSTSEHLF